MQVRGKSRWGAVAAVAMSVSLASCAASSRPAASGPDSPAPAWEETPVPTVPPAPVTPPPTPAPLPTRAVGRDDVKARKGEPVGPVLTYLGVARADGLPVDPPSVEGGLPTWVVGAGAGFILVVEAKPGLAGHEVARRIFVHKPDDPTARPDLELIVSRPLGDGSPKVCDRRRPDIGGIPAASGFGETQTIADTLNDMACRFETFNDPESACTVDKNGDFRFASDDTTQQFCMIVARAWAFPEGDTIVTARVRDMKGNPGPAKKIRIRRPKAPKVPPTPAVAPTPKPTGPKALPTRGA